MSASLALSCSRRDTAPMTDDPDLEARTRLGEAAFNHRDFEEAVTFSKSDAVWDASPVGLGIHEGREAMRAFFEDWLASYEDFEQVSTEFREFGNGVTLDVKRQRARLVGSNESVEIHFAAVTAWTDGLVERIITYTDIAEARSVAERLAKERG